MKYAKKVLMWSLFALALTPAMYANSTITPAQNAKTLFFRCFMCIASVMFAYILIADNAFRDGIRTRLAILWKHPLTKIIAISFAILAVSSIFAYHRDVGFFGEPEREEGFLGLSFFYTFFLFAVLLFQKKDWYTFFGILMSTQIVVFSTAFLQLMHGFNRTNSVLGNPIYFAVYALCLVCISALVYIKAKKEKRSGAKFFSALVFIIAVVELFLGNTRSVLLGVVVAFPIAFVYGVIHSESIFPRIKKRTVNITAISIATFFILFGGIFIATRHATIWSHIPGFDRISTSTVGDSTTKARIVSWSIAVHSINPAQVGITRSLFGYGWDNYFFAWQKFYQSRLYQYDTATFDHPHNKLLDMLVMNGILGFIAYMLLWFCFIRAVVRYGKREPAVAMVLLFWAVAYFIQNLFAFDSINSWMMSFALFAFVILETSDGQAIQIEKTKDKK